MRLLLLLFALCPCLSTAAGDDSPEWVQETRSAITAIRAELATADAASFDSETFERWQIELSRLETPVQRCIDHNEDQLAKIEAETGSGSSDSQPAEGDSKPAGDSKELDELKRKPQQRLLTCQKLKLEIETLVDNIRGTQQSLLAERLLAGGPHLPQVILDNVREASGWLDSIEIYLADRLQLHELEKHHWAAIIIALLLGAFIGHLLKQRMMSFAHNLTQDELTTRMLQSLLCCFSSAVSWLLPVLGVLLALFLLMDTDPLPPSIALLSMIAGYFLIAPALGAFLSPREPARPFLPIDPAYGNYLNNRLQTLLLLGLVILLVAISDLRSALTTDQWHMTRGALLLLTGINLVWLLSLLNRLPGLIGSTTVRTVMMGVLLVSMIAEVAGYRNLSSYLFAGLTGTTLLAGLLWLTIAVLTDIFDGLDEGRHRWQKHLRARLRLQDEEPVPGLIWLRLVTMLVAWTFFIISTVRLWGYNAASWTALGKLLTEGFELGDFRIVPMKLFIGIVIFSLLIATLRWYRQETLPRWLSRTRLDHGAREAVISISGYVGVIIAALFGLSLAGFNFTNIAIIAGALSVGIGFGLQNIVNNFVSGIILLFERPIRTGDWIEVGTTTGFVRKISIRSTQIETFDRADIIVPNSELISNQVTNWMLNDLWGRVIVPIGVAYGSDVARVREVLLKAAEEHELVMKDGKDVDPPSVLFRAFGDSSLDFELRCFISAVNKRLSTLSDLNFAIEKGLRDAGVEIPFPQRDLHLRSVSEEAGAALSSRRGDSGTSD